MVQIKTSQISERGGSRATSFGKIEFDENGIGSVESQEIADKLVSIDPTLSLVKIPQSSGPIPPVNNVEDDKGTQDEGGDDESDKSQQTTSEESEEIKELRAQLLEKPMGDLRSILQEAGVDEAEYSGEEYKGKENKGALVDFVISKVSKSE